MVKWKLFQGAEPNLKKQWLNEGLPEAAEIDDCIRRWVQPECGETVTSYYDGGRGNISNDTDGHPMDLSVIANSKQWPKKTSNAWDAWCRQNNACFQCSQTGCHAAQI